jgi:hypothetical protein
MARFNMKTAYVVTNEAVAQATVETIRAPHHRVMLQTLVDAGPQEESRPITAQDLFDWMQENKEDVLTDEQLAIWDRYSDECHMKYFTERCSGKGVIVFENKPAKQEELYAQLSA